MPKTAHSSAPPPAACLAVMLKAPSRSKRRLAGELGPEAATAAGYLLACALEDAESWHGPTVLAAAADDDGEWLERRGHAREEILIQQGGSLGARINYVDRTLRGRGFDRIIFIGSDCPALDQDYLAAADHALDRADAVLGPAEDGGVVLMAARRPWPDIASLAWSTPALRRELVERLNGEDWRVGHLASLSDVDSAQDLAKLRETLTGDVRPARAGLYDWLAARDVTPAGPAQ